jgi:hypothetical protein
MASGVCLQDDILGGHKSGALKKGTVLERLQNVEALMEAIHLEQEHKKELKKKAA